MKVESRQPGSSASAHEHSSNGKLCLAKIRTRLPVSAIANLCGDDPRKKKLEKALNRYKLPVDGSRLPPIMAACQVIFGGIRIGIMRADSY